MPLTGSLDAADKKRPGQKIAEWGRKTWGTIKSAVTTVYTDLKDFANKIVDKSSETANHAIDTGGSVITETIDTAGNVVEKGFQLGSNVILVVGLALGGILLFMLMNPKETTKIATTGMETAGRFAPL